MANGLHSSEEVLTFIDSLQGGNENFKKEDVIKLLLNIDETENTLKNALNDITKMKKLIEKSPLKNEVQDLKAKVNEVEEDLKKQNAVIGKTNSKIASICKNSNQKFRKSLHDTNKICLNGASEFFKLKKVFVALMESNDKNIKKIDKAILNVVALSESNHAIKTGYKNIFKTLIGKGTSRE